MISVARGPKLKFETNQGPSKRFQHLPNIHSTKGERMLGKCWMTGLFKWFQR